MAGGTFISQNKRRPGAYINFRGVAKPASTLGVRGIVTFPAPMSWGAPVTELLSTDLVDGKSIPKIGFSAMDEEALLFALALQNAYKAIVYRLDTGGTKAQGSIGNLTINAKYPGIVGNDIRVVSTTKDSKFEITTYYKNALKDTQVVETIAELVNNAWVDFSGSGVLTASVGTMLSGGTNGTISTTTYTDYFNAIKGYRWNTMGIPQDVPTVNAAAITFIKDLRDNKGKKVQAVLFNVDSDHEGIISVGEGYATKDITVSPTAFVAYYAGLTAGTDATKSNTYHVINGAVTIVYPAGVTPYDDEEIEARLKAGKIVLSTRQDGKVVVEQDINTFHNFAPDKGYTFSKNRVIRTLDEINNSVALLWENTYIGKVDNDGDGRNLFKADIIHYLGLLQASGGIQNFVPEDVVIYAGNDIDAVIVELAIQPVDSMEKLYMTVMVG